MRQRPRAVPALLGIGIAVLAVAVLLPPDALRWLRVNVHAFNLPMGWLESMSVHVNVIHVLLFAWIGAAWRTWRPEGAGLLRMWPLVVLAGASEAVQWLVPGRDPLWRDLGWDLVGMTLGTLAVDGARRRRDPDAERRSTQAAALRGWLAACLRGEVTTTWPADAVAAVQAARDEGVVALVDAHLRQANDVPADLRDAFAAAARASAAQGLLQEMGSRRVVALLGAAGVDCLLLKGAALAWWLYPSPQLRESTDIDVLVSSRGEADRALAALRAAGYATPLAIPGDLVGFEMLCVPAGPEGMAAPVDLHWRLCNSMLFGDPLRWDELRAAARPLPPGAPAARGLAPVHALLHACLHRALKLPFGEGDALRGAYDLRLLAARQDEGDWDEIVRLASQRAIAAPCAHALAAAAEVGAVVPARVQSALATAARGERVDMDRLRGWAHAQWATWRALPGWGLRLRWLRQRLLPEREFVRDMYGDAGLHTRVAAGWRRLRSRR